jgi:glycosyltransferase involved in cell wall biosynthesis
MNPLSIWLFCICRDEARIMPYLLRHYAPWVTKFVFFDGGSTDGTQDIIRSCHTAELRKWPGSDGINDDEMLTFANEAWKEARGKADWVLWIDADEFLFHPAITDVLRRYLADDVEVPQIQGFTMVSKAFPTTTGQIYEEVRRGFPDDIWGKPAVFRKHMQWTVGRHGVDYHQFKPKNSAHPELKLLHYRALGVDYVRWRHARNWERVPERCRAMNMGTNTAPGHAGHHGLAWFEEQIGRDWPEVI